MRTTSVRRRASNDEFHMATSADDPYASMRRRAMIHEFHLGPWCFTLLARPSSPSLPPAPAALKQRAACAAARDPVRIIFAYCELPWAVHAQCKTTLPNLAALTLVFDGVLSDSEESSKANEKKAATCASYAL